MAQVVYRRNCFGDLKNQKLMFLILLVCSVGVWMWIMERLADSQSFTVRVRIEEIWNKLPGDSLEPWVPLEYLTAKQPRQHVFFLNTHKAGGSIVRNILLLFAQRNNLTVLLPQRGLCFSHDSKNYWDNKDPQSEGRVNDILCDYLVFNQTFTDSLMPQDTLYVGIVRDPFEQFLAAFQKYGRVLPAKKNYLRAIPGLYPVATYLGDPQRWEHPNPSKSFTNNRMSFDFGLDVDLWKDKAAVGRYLQYLENTFHLVMVAEKFDESLILLRRLAHWSLKDILYIQVSDFEILKRYTFNETQRQRHRTFQYPDYALYRRFEAILYKKISEQVHYGFYSELAKYRDARKAVQVFCEKMPTGFIRIKASRWNEAFVVTKEDCRYMTGVLPLVNRSNLAKNYNYQYFKEETQLLFNRL